MAAQKRSAELEVRCGALARGKARADLDHKQAMEVCASTLGFVNKHVCVCVCTYPCICI